MLIIKDISNLKSYLTAYQNRKYSIGFVPTMGALHKGHGELIKKSKNDNHKTIVSIFVNEKQFNSKEDFNSYPRNKGLDYDFWCGPSEKLPYIFARHHRYWRFHDAFGGGQIMDWIGHHNDIAHWGIGMDYGGPVKVEAIGWTFPPTDVYNTAVNYDIRCRYKNGITSSISDKHAIGVKWVGENGWVHISRKSMKASNPEFLRESFNRGKIKADVSNNHTRNFIECVRSRESCIAPAEVGHRSITPGHLGIVSQAVGRPLKWDPKTETIVGDEDADRLLKAVPYRKPWKLG